MSRANGEDTARFSDGTLVYLVRHGQSYNTHPRPDEPFPVDPPLTPVGESEARLVAERFRGLGLDRLICSPMTRTVQTARTIAAAVDLPVEVWPECHEFRDTPGYHCCGGPELRRRFPDLIVPPDFAPNGWEYGGESLESCVRRADRFLARLRTLVGSARRVAVVSHGAFARIVVSRVLEAEPAAAARVVVDNTAVSTLELGADQATLLGLNDTSHLAGLPELDPVRGVTR